MATSTYSWTLNARQQQGKLILSWNTNSPFRAQQGKIVVYKGTSFPAKASDNIEKWSWDNENNHDWNTDLTWGTDWCCAWIAEQSPNGPYVYNVRLVTTGQSQPRSETSE
ncbi:MAG: hypothetical protein WCC64_11035 [Aliidongia sp.]